MTDPTTDPLDVLRLPSTPLAPDPAFAARLRARLATALDPTSSGGPTMTTQTDTTDHRRSPPRRPDPRCRPTSSSPTPVRPSPGTPTCSAAPSARPSRCPTAGSATPRSTSAPPVLMLADEFPEMGLLAPVARGGTTVSLVLDVADVDATTAAAVERGPPSSGSRPTCPTASVPPRVVDPFGHRWLIEAPARGSARRPARRPGGGRNGPGPAPPAR